MEGRIIDLFTFLSGVKLINVEYEITEITMFNKHNQQCNTVYINGRHTNNNDVIIFREHA